MSIILSCGQGLLTSTDSFLSISSENIDSFRRYVAFIGSFYLLITITISISLYNVILIYILIIIQHIYRELLT